MAVIVPEDFDTSTLEHSERRVLEALRDRLDDDWFLIPSVHVRAPGSGPRDRHPGLSAAYGAIVLETKGGGVTVDGDRWCSYDTEIKNPFHQGSGAKYALLDLMPRSGLAASASLHLPRGRAARHLGRPEASGSTPRRSS